MTNLQKHVDRKVVLDTETTGMNREGGPHYMGHRIIEIGAVDLHLVGLIKHEVLWHRSMLAWLNPSDLGSPHSIFTHSE